MLHLPRPHTAESGDESSSSSATQDELATGNAEKTGAKKNASGEGLQRGVKAKRTGQLADTEVTDQHAKIARAED